MVFGQGADEVARGGVPELCEGVGQADALPSLQLVGLVQLRAREEPTADQEVEDEVARGGVPELRARVGQAGGVPALQLAGLVQLRVREEPTADQEVEEV